MRQFKFSQRSLDNLKTCHPVLQLLAKKALAKGTLDFTVICGHRDKASQDAAFKAGTSGLRWPKSYHNKLPSAAMDIVPYPFISWKDIAAFEALGSLIQETWNEMTDDEKEGYSLFWGKNWKGLVDYPHWQITK